jgi:hypothetical protein
MNKERAPLPKVEECIAYMNSLGWRTVLRKNFSYTFVNRNAPPHMNPMWFSLSELRHAFQYGF